MITAPRVATRAQREERDTQSPSRTSTRAARWQSVATGDGHQAYSMALSRHQLLQSSGTLLKSMNSMRPTGSPPTLMSK